MEVDVPVIAVAIAALPVIALLLAVLTRMESTFFGDGNRSADGKGDR
jgi:hypothetical protein